MCEFRCADFVVGAALGAPRGTDLVAGAALGEPRSADFVAGKDSVTLDAQISWQVQQNLL